jgi:hypothetical protein
VWNENSVYEAVMNQEKPSNVQSSRLIPHPLVTPPGTEIASSHELNSHEEGLRRSADQDFLRSLSQLEQTLLVESAPTEFSSPLPTPLSIGEASWTPAESPVESANVDVVPNPLQNAIRHLHVEESDIIMADIEQFIEDQGIPLDSPLANHIRTAAESMSMELKSPELDN